jgi:protein-L-isoaspartate(D-aspartate) O-methyltransferase
MSAAETAHHHLIDQLIGRGALWSGPLIEAFRSTPRHLFLDRVFCYQSARQDNEPGRWREVCTKNPGRAELRLLYSDRALTTRLSASPGRVAVPISSSTQPSLMAQMLEDLHLRPGLRVLELGTGTGYNAALLARLAGRVVSVDVDREVLAEAAAHLRAFPDRKVQLHCGDGRQGFPAEAPFDRILVTAATPDVEPAWLEQLAPAGLLVAPLELAPGVAYLLRGTVTANAEGCAFEGHLTRPAYFMPLRGEADSGDDVGMATPLPPLEHLAACAAPWAEWVGRRSAGGPGLLPALAFLAWLEGYAVAGRTLADQRTFFAVADLAHDRVCWLGEEEWRTTGAAGRELGWRLWCRFLEAGGPWPTEFRLRAWPQGAAGEEMPGAALAFRRQGPRCDHLWELLEPRERHSGD